jgi:hypothetical protein
MEQESQQATLLEMQKKLDQIILAANSIAKELRQMQSNGDKRTSKSEVSRQLCISVNTINKLLAQGVLRIGVHYTINQSGRYYFDINATRTRLEEVGYIVSEPER